MAVMAPPGAPPVDPPKWVGGGGGGNDDGKPEPPPPVPWVKILLVILAVLLGFALFCIGLA